MLSVRLLYCCEYFVITILLLCVQIMHWFNSCLVDRSVAVYSTVIFTDVETQLLRSIYIPAGITWYTAWYLIRYSLRRFWNVSGLLIELSYLHHSGNGRSLYDFFAIFPWTAGASRGQAQLLFERSEFLIATSKKKKLSVCPCARVFD